MFPIEPINTAFREIREKVTMVSMSVVVYEQLKLLKKFCIEHQQYIEDISYKLLDTYRPSVEIKVYFTDCICIGFEFCSTTTFVKLKTLYEQSTYNRFFYISMWDDINPLSSKYKNLLDWFKVSLLLTSDVLNKTCKIEHILGNNYDSFSKHN